MSQRTQQGLSDVEAVSELTGHRMFRPDEPQRARLPRIADQPRAQAEAEDRAEHLGPARTFAGDTRGFVLRRRLAFSDLLGLSLAGAIGVGIAASLGRPPLESGAVAAFVVSLPVWLLIANSVGLYHISDRRLGPSAADEIGPVVFALTMWGWCLLLLEALFHGGSPDLLRSVILWVVGFATVIGLRGLTRALARRRPWYEQRVAILGSALDVQRVTRRLKRHPELGLKVACVGDVSDDLSVGDGGPEIIKLVASSNINRVILASFDGDLDQRSELLRALSELRVHIDVVSAESDAIPSHGTLHYMEGLPLLTIAAVRAPRSHAVFKRAFDLLAAGGGLVVLSPVLAYCAIRVRLESSGPALFRQVRVGKNGKPFEMLKFRTMSADAEHRKDELVELNMHSYGDTPGMFKVANDPRTTRFGAWLRKWSIDELPQLVNVFKGDMSLVGPRPLIPEEARLVNGHHEARLTARPGITGPWQTLGRSDIGFEDMVKLDYAYVMNPSFAEDLKLLMRTVNAVLGQRGAY